MATMSGDVSDEKISAETFTLRPDITGSTGKEQTNTIQMRHKSKKKLRFLGAPHLDFL